MCGGRRADRAAHVGAVNPYQLYVKDFTGEQPADAFSSFVHELAASPAQLR